MTDELMPDAVTPPNPMTVQRANALARESGGCAEVVRDDQRHWIAIEEIPSKISFVDAEGDEVHIVPFVGDVEAVRAQPYVVSMGPSWLDGEQELVIDMRTLAGSPFKDEVLSVRSRALRSCASQTDQGAFAVPIPPMLTLRPS